ncbi:hypothetical protein [Salipiger mucosus]|uniref:hypothetical protein n=1 Tax=Salipiger mucosus TaxID=263378 RepID=UPI0012EB519C|nr:hypothetical protein [Salipiger mucosus]
MSGSRSASGASGAAAWPPGRTGASLETATRASGSSLASGAAGASVPVTASGRAAGVVSGALASGALGGELSAGPSPASATCASSAGRLAGGTTS